MARATGKWPCPVFGFPELPVTMPACPRCAASEITVSHALLACPGLSDLRVKLAQAVGPLEHLDHKAFLITLFGHNPAPGHRIHHINYVGTALQPSLQLLGTAADHLAARAAGDGDLFSDARVAILRSETTGADAERSGFFYADDGPDGGFEEIDWSII